MTQTQREITLNLGSHLPRRDFLRAGLLTVSLSAIAADSRLTNADTPVHEPTPDSMKPASQTELKIALITDLHYADKLAAGTRHYRDTLRKFDEAADQYQRESVDLLIELGDLIDAADSPETEKVWLTTINSRLKNVCNDRHYVLGNHCVDTLTKPEFLEEVQQQKSWYSFDRKGWHFVILDACFRQDGTPYGRHNFEWTDANVPSEELEWLREDLRSNHKPVIVFTHQRLDDPGNHGVRNQADIRQVLQASGRVVSVFQGHSHANDLKLIEGIPYCTLVAMVEGSAPENSGYSTLELYSDGSAQLHGFRKQRSQEWQARTPH